MMMRKILIPTDFSDNAWNAIEYILDFCKNVPTTYVLAHIQPPDHMSQEMETLKAYFTGYTLKSHKLMDELHLVKHKMLKQLDSAVHHIQTICIESNFVEGIKKLVKQHEIDLIVMGTKGESQSSNIPVGSHTRAVITRIQCPLLVVPEQAKFTHNYNIVFPTDYDIIYKDRVLCTLTTIASLHNAKLKVLRVANTKMPLSTFQSKNRAYLKDYVHNTSSSFHKVDHPDLEYGIQSFIDSMDIGMIAMIAKNLNFFQKLLFNPRVVQMSYHFKIPFLVLHE